MQTHRAPLLLLFVADALCAQGSPDLIRGSVRSRADQPINGANVFVLGTLDGSVTDSVGKFEILTLHRAAYTIAVRRFGFRDTTISVAHGATDSVRIVMRPVSTPLSPIVVQAGRYTASDEAGAVLTPLEVATTPGTAAEVNRAIQTLPGVQQVDEGNGLYVRGGDFTETKVFLNEGMLLTTAAMQNPVGTFVGAIDPFLLDAVHFIAGGFGARYGDALSATVSLHPLGRPDHRSATISAGLAAIGINVAMPGPHGLGLRAVTGRNNLQPVLQLNGSPRQFTEAPQGADESASLFWNYRATARLSAFATDQTQRLGTLSQSPSVVDTFAVRTRERAVVLRWQDVFGRFAPDVVLSSSDIRRTESYGSYDLASPTRLSRAAAAMDIAVTDATTARVGAEYVHTQAALAGSLPEFGDDQRPDARVRLFSLEHGARRTAEYLEMDTRLANAVRLVAGVRHDRIVPVRMSTLDPRLSASMRVAPEAILIAAWGWYHQTVDPLLQLLIPDPDVALRSMRARHAILGVQLGDATPMIRVEAYDKTYSDLASATRDFVTVRGGSGRARGADVIIRAPPVLGIATRLVYSRSSSRRTDPNTGRMAPAPFDVPDNLTIITSRALPGPVIVGASLRYASGRPFTPVVSATMSPGDTVWTPMYAAPGSDRLPAFSRVDLSASWVRKVSDRAQMVAYVAVTNVFDRPNVYMRRYTADYTKQYDIRSIFNRSLYFGVVGTFEER